jgi:hypothetical protein
VGEAKEEEKMYANGVTTKNEIAEEEREAFKQALVLYYTQGPPIAKAFDQVEAGLIDRYYRRRKEHPEEIEKIDLTARAKAFQETLGERIAFEAWQFRQSREIQLRTAEILKEAISELERIIRGGPRTVGDKTVIPYPRDVIAAIRLLVDIAREGIAPKQRMDAVLQAYEESQRQEEKKGLELPLNFGISANFGTLTAIRPDGTRFSTSDGGHNGGARGGGGKRQALDDA